jgi:hypothetical protein
VSNCDHTNDPRFHSGVDFLIAAECYAVSQIAVHNNTRVADKIMRTAQLMVLDTMPVCMYREVLGEALKEVYPPEIRAEIADKAEENAKNSPQELTAVQREQRAEWIRKLREV